MNSVEEKKLADAAAKKKAEEEVQSSEVQKVEKEVVKPQPVPIIKGPERRVIQETLGRMLDLTKYPTPKKYELLESFLLQTRAESSFPQKWLVLELRVGADLNILLIPDGPGLNIRDTQIAVIPGKTK